MPKRRYVDPIDPPLPHLPQEILEEIFLNLKFADLLQARLTCHRWRDTIAGCPSLRDKFWITFPHDRKITKINRNYEPPGTFPASNVEFNLDKYSKIGTINAWWPQVASTVTCLVMGGCEFPVDMLRHAPNLKTLELDCARVVGSTKVDFKLSNLRKLSLKESCPGQLSRMITRLEVLNCETKNDNWENLCAIVELIKSVHLTLAELTTEVPARYLLEFAQLKELRLKKVYLDVYEKEVEMIEFVQAHPSIEDLTIADSIDNEAFRKSVQAPTNLKRLKLKYMWPIFYDQYKEKLPEIPNNLSNLEYLQIECVDMSNGHVLQIQRGAQFPKLKELYFELVDFKGESLRKSLLSSPNLRTLTLSNCGFESWNQLVRLIAHPKELRSLTILLGSDIKWIDPDQISIKPRESLRYLRIGINHENVPMTKIATLVWIFPLLTELYLDFGVDDELVKEVCRTLTRLEMLSMCVGSTTHSAIDYIRQYCRNLKHLKLFGLWKLKKEDSDFFEHNLERFTYDKVDLRLSNLTERLASLSKRLDELD